MGAREDLAKAIVVTAEVMGHEISPAAAAAMALELAGEKRQDVGLALRRCQRELSGRLTLAAILARLPGGHPSADEAWALCPRSEAVTVVWTPEIAEAYGAAVPLLESGDQVAARMTFREVYAEAVRDAMDRGERSPRWTVSLGTDPAGRGSELLRGVERGRLGAEYVRGLIGGLPDAEQLERRLAAHCGEPIALPAASANTELIAAFAAKVGKRVGGQA